METIGFIGLGRMGGAMSRRLVSAGHRVLGVDPAPEARRRAAAGGVEVSADLESAVGAGVVITSLPDTPQVEEVYRRLFRLLSPGALCLDMSTIDVAASRKLAVMGRDAGHHFCDCPVSGTSIHAEEGTLVVMIGGEEEAAARARPILAPLGRAVHHLGGNGAGLTLKLVTNRLLTSHLVAIAEAIVEVESLGLDVGSCLEAIAGGAVPRLLEYKAGPMSRRDHSPLFTVDLMVKDLALASRMSLAGPVGSASHRVMMDTREHGLGGEDITAVIEVLSASSPGPGG